MLPPIHCLHAVSNTVLSTYCTADGHSCLLFIGANSCELALVLRNVFNQSLGCFWVQTPDGVDFFFSVPFFSFLSSKLVPHSPPTLCRLATTTRSHILFFTCLWSNISNTHALMAPVLSLVMALVTARHHVCRRHKEVSYMECTALWQEAQASGCSLFGQLCESPRLLIC